MSAANDAQPWETDSPENENPNGVALTLGPPLRIWTLENTGWLNVAELARVWTYHEEVQILANSATKSPSRRCPLGLCQVADLFALSLDRMDFLMSATVIAQSTARFNTIKEKPMPRPRICSLFLALMFCAQASADEAFPAHRILGNVYYVGSKALAIYLITTPDGHVLINSGFEETVPLIRASVESLGFKMRDVKVLLESHAHSDHVAGHGRLQSLTGARVVVMRGDHSVIASGGQGQYLYTDSRWKPCRVDRVLDDGDTVKLGSVTLTAHLTPGHTRGCTTWSWQVAEGDKTHDVVVIGSPNVNPGYRLVDNMDYPQIAADFTKTFAVLKELPCDIFLGAHGAYYGMLAKYERLTTASTNPFNDPAGYRAYVEQKEHAFRQTLADQSK